MRRVIVAAIVILVGIVLIGLCAWYLLSTQRPFEGTPELITIGIPPNIDSSGLIYIAVDQGFFADNGLNVTLKDYEVGFKAVDGMLKNENDLAIATEFVIVSKALEKEKIYGIATVARYDDKFIIGRRDRGIEDAPDLEGKTIGCDRGTVSEFYLGRFLEVHDISLTDVTIVNLKRTQLTNAIVNGTVDAIIIWGPEVDTIKGELGPGAVVLPAQSGQLGYWLAITRDDWAAQHPELVSRFLRSMDQAVDYTIYHPAEAKAITKKWRNSDDGYIATIWSNTQFSLSLDESLITAMEDEARWMISNNLTAEKNVPDFRDYINTSGLREVKPESVNIIT